MKNEKLQFKGNMEVYPEEEIKIGHEGSSLNFGYFNYPS